MQIVYLSNRPKILNKTLEQVSRFMPFIDQVVVICPKSMTSQIESDLDIVFIVEEDLLAGSNRNFDHVSLNYFLRAQAIRKDIIAEAFIMSDDDARPVKPIDESIYVEDEKIKSYYFYDLIDWHFHGTDYDKGQQNTFVLLKSLDLTHKAFSAHMPQIIDKGIFLESMETFKSFSDQYSICEWTSYFNFAQKHYPNKFHPPQPYLTMGWPTFPGDWPKYVEQDNYSFENYNPQHYTKNGIFQEVAECPRLDDYQMNIFEKSRILRLIECGRYVAPVMANDPWRIKSWKHRLLYRFVRYGNGYMRKVMVGERSKMK